MTALQGLERVLNFHLIVPEFHKPEAHFIERAKFDVDLTPARVNVKTLGALPVYSGSFNRLFTFAAPRISG